MRITAIRLRDVRRFGPEGLALEGLQPGLNVLSRPNEFGKSTILDALRTGLFIKATSAGKETKSLVPLKGGDPVIEIDFEAAGDLYRLRKCFAGAKKASEAALREVASGRRLTGSEAEDRVAELLGTARADAGVPGLLWLRQGDSLEPGLESEQGRTVQSLLADEMAATAAGPELQAVLERTEKALFALETASKGLPTGELKALLDEVAEVEAELAVWSRKVAESETLREQAAALRARAVRLEDPDEAAHLEADLKAAREEAEQLAADVVKVGHTEERLERALAEAQRRADRLADHRLRLEDAAKLAADLGMAERQLAELRDACGHTATRRQSCETALRKAQGEYDQATAALRAATRHDDRKRFAEERKRSASLLEEARTVAARLSAALTLLKGPAIDVAALRAAERRLVEAQAALAAGSPRLEVEEGPGVRVDGEEVRPGEAVRITGDGVIEAGGTRLRLYVPGREERAAAAARAEAQLEQLLAAIPVRTISEAAERAEERRIAEREAATLKAELQRLAPEGLEALATALAAMPDTDLDDEEPVSLSREDAERQAAEAGRRRDEAERALKEAARLFEETDRRRYEAELNLRHMRNRLAELEGQLGAAEDREAKTATLEGEARQADEEVLGIRARLDKLREDTRRGDAVRGRLKRLEDLHASRQRELSQVRLQLADLHGRLAQGFADGAEEREEQVRQHRGALRRRLEQIEARRRALRLLRETLIEEAGARRAQLMAPALAEILPLVKQVLGPSELRFDDEWNPETLEREGEGLDAAQLSKGTREQLALLTRIGFARLAARRGHPMPLILDDALAYADDERALRLFDVLHALAEETQVIVLTCHERLFDALGGHRIEPTPFADADRLAS